MNFKHLFLGLFAIVSLSACSGNDSEAPRAISGDNVVVDDGDGSSYEAGVPYITFNKESDQVWVDGAVVDEINGETFSGYPMLEKNVSVLRATTKAIETKENALELWNGESLVLAMDLRGDAPVLLHSPADFAAERIVFTRSEAEQGQGLSNATVTFDLRECRIDEKEQEQEQDQGKVEEPTKGEEQDDKGQDQDQGQGQGVVAGEGEQDQGQEQGEGKDQEQEKGEDKEPAQICKTSTVTLNLAELAREEEKEQDQGKVEEPKEEAPKQEEDKGQDQDQGKGNDQDQGNEQGKDEGKVEEPKEEAPKQEEDKGQEQEEDKGQDQDQGDKDQGQQEEKN